MQKMINCHAHLFTADHVPEDLFKLYVKWLPNFAISPISNFLNSSVGNFLLGWTNKLGNDPLKRYGNFLKFGYEHSIRTQFNILKNAYPPETRFVILMQNFKYISNSQAKVNFDSYKQEIYALKRDFPEIILPFHFMEPRLIGYNDHPDLLLHQCKQDIEDGLCQGFKMYPAEGYFPFDYRLKSMYQFAVDHDLPIMTHASIGGSRYVKQTTDLDKNVMDLKGSPQYINIPKLKWFNVAKDYTGRARIFSDPENYRKVLDIDTFKSLKICLGHAGSDAEIEIEIKNRHNGTSHSNWYQKCLKMIDDYPNVYLDISYSLWNPVFIAELIARDFDIKSTDPKIVHRCNRVLFGTDFYLTYTEFNSSDTNPSSIERDLWENTRAKLDPILFQKMAFQNSYNWIKSTFYN